MCKCKKCGKEKESTFKRDIAKSKQSEVVAKAQYEFRRDLEAEKKAEDSK